MAHGSPESTGETIQQVEASVAALSALIRLAQTPEHSEEYPDAVEACVAVARADVDARELMIRAGAASPLVRLRRWAAIDIGQDFDMPTEAYVATFAGLLSDADPTIRAEAIDTLMSNDPRPDLTWRQMRPLIELMVSHLVS